MSERFTVGDLVAEFLERCASPMAFGVISIHNMPILDAIARRNRLRFVPARGEAGALNMADGYTRVSGGLGIAITSTGTAAGNAAGALVEAQTAGTPLLHLTGQIETGYLDRNCAYIHEARDQLGMLRAVSKAAFRLQSPESALPVLREAVATARSAPSGPVSVEIPIDIQAATVDPSDDLEPVAPAPVQPDPDALDALARALSGTRRPLLWLGGGARHADEPVARLVEMGFGVVTSTNGRGILPEDHAMTLGAFTMQPAIEAFYATCDAMLVVGSRLRGNETLKYALKLPKPLYQIDADLLGRSQTYPMDDYVTGDAALALTGLADRLQGKFSADPAFAADLKQAADAAAADLRAGLGPYESLVDTLQQHLDRDFVWVRDVTISNSTWGNRLLKISGPRDGVHALGGGIGQGLQMGIGAALAAGGRRTVSLVGDGGLQVNSGELATAVQEQADLLLLVMNSGGYGVIKNIQDAHYGGRHCYVDLLTPDLEKLCQSVGMRFSRLQSIVEFQSLLEAALAKPGPAMIEVDMAAIGPFARAFAGPPARKEAR